MSKLTPGYSVIGVIDHHERARSDPAHEENILSSGRSYPYILIPFDRREACTVKEAAYISGKSGATIREWAARFNIGRRVGGGVWMISRPALLMLLDNDHVALKSYLDGDRTALHVVSYFKRAGVFLSPS